MCCWWFEKNSTYVLQGCSDCDDGPVPETKNSEDHLFWWFIGIILLTFALLLSARMGIFQESIAQRYGKNPRESLYYTVI